MKISKLVAGKKYPYTTRSGNVGYMYWDGLLYNSWGQKTLNIFCPDCVSSKNKHIAAAAKNCLFTVHVANMHRDIPCGCSDKVEKIGGKLGIDFFLGTEWSSGKTTYVLGKTLSHKAVLCREFTCSVCSRDLELFPEPFFGPAHKLREGVFNCGCGSYRYNEAQQALRVKRVCAEIGYTFQGFVGKWRGYNTKCRLTCPVHGEYQTCSVDNFLRGRRCPACGTLLRSKDGNHNGFYKSRSKEKDYLYLLDLVGSLKVGRSFNIKDRLRGIKASAKLAEKPIVVLSYTASHEIIYKVEQELHDKLSRKGYHPPCDWTRECFSYNCKEYLTSLLTEYEDNGIILKVQKEIQ